MNEQEANTIINIVETGWSFQYEPENREQWLTYLADEDSAVVTQAVVRLAERQSKQRPTLGDLRRTVAQCAPQTDETDDPAAYATPEWVHVWAYMRFKKRDFRLLPQQQAPMPGVTAAEYDNIRDEWHAAGAPRMRIGDLRVLHTTT